MTTATNVTTGDWVHDAIAKYTGVTSPAELAEIRDIMADTVRSFSSLSPAQFRNEAQTAKAVADYLKTDAGRAYEAELAAEFAA